MSATGSFQVTSLRLHQGNHEEDMDEVSSQAEELGEAAGSRRRERRRSTRRRRHTAPPPPAPTPTPPPTPPPSKEEEKKQEAPSKEEEEKQEEKQAPGFNATSWLQCESEGGSKQCAECDSTPGGMLPCKSVPSPPPGDWSNEGKGPAINEIDACPDHEILKNRKVFVQYGAGGSRCLPFFSWMSLNGLELKSRQFPGVNASHISDDVGNVVITKMAVLKPNGASANVGVLIVKRLVTHKCIGTKAGASCSADATTADTLKLGYCIKCPVKKYTKKPNCGSRCSVFSSSGAHASDDEKKAFVDECAPDAYDAATGDVKTEYECTDKDAKEATATMMSF